MMAEIANVYKIKGELRSNAGKLSVTPVFEKSVEGLYKIASDSKFLRSRIYASAALGELAGELKFESRLKPSDKEERNHKDIYLAALQQFRVANPVEEQCEGDLKGTKRTLNYCVNFDSCILALGHFSSFAKGYPETGDENPVERIKNKGASKLTPIDLKIRNRFDQTLRGLEGDVQCITTAATKDTLTYKLNVGRVLYGFLRTVRWSARDRIGVTPMAYAGESGVSIRQMGTNQDRIGDMRRHLDALIEFGKARLFSTDGDGVAKNTLIKAFVNGVTKKPYKDLKLEERKAVQELLDHYVFSNEGTYRLARRLRFLIERLNHQDIRPFLKCIRERTKAWYANARPGKRNFFMEIGEADRVDIPNCPNFALSADEAFELLNWYGRYEMKMPFRQPYLDLMIAVVRMMSTESSSKVHSVKTKDGNSVKLSNYHLMIEGYRRLKENTDNELRNSLTSARLPNGNSYPVGLVEKDELIATYMRNYHSLFFNLHKTLRAQKENNDELAEMRYIMGEKLDKQSMQIAYNRRGIEDDPSKLYKEGKTEVKQTREEFTNEEKKEALEKAKQLNHSRQSHDLSYACLDYRFGKPGPRRIDTRGDQGFRPSFGCWEALYFGTTRGLVEGVLDAGTSVLTLGGMYEAPEPLVEEYVAWAEYLAEKVWLGGFNKERDNPFHKYDFEGSEDGSYSLEKLCRLEDDFGKVNYKYLRERINHWTYAQSVYEDCESFTLVAAINIITLITLPLTGAGTNVIVGMILKNALKTGLKAALKRAGVAYTASAIATSAAGRAILGKYILTVARNWAIHALLGGTIFTIIDHLVMASIGLRPFWDPHIIQHWKMGVGVMGIIGIVNPALARLSGMAVQGLVRRGFQSTAEYTAAGLTFTGEVVFFAHLQDTIKFMDNSYRWAVGMDPAIDESWREKYKLNKWVHAFLLTAAFKVGHNPVKQARDAIAEVREWSLFFKRDIQIREMVGEGPLDYYRILELEKGKESTPAEINEAFTNHRKRHENVPGSEAQSRMAMAEDAHATLSDPVKKEAYDSVYEKMVVANSMASAKELGTNNPSDAVNHYKRLGLERDAFDTMTESQIESTILEALFRRQLLIQEQLKGVGDRKVLEDAMNNLKESFDVIIDPYKRSDHRRYLDNIEANAPKNQSGNAEKSGESKYDHRESVELAASVRENQ